MEEIHKKQEHSQLLYGACLNRMAMTVILTIFTFMSYSFVKLKMTFPKKVCIFI